MKVSAGFKLRDAWLSPGAMLLALMALAACSSRKDEGAADAEAKDAMIDAGLGSSDAGVLDAEVLDAAGSDGGPDGGGLPDATQVLACSAAPGLAPGEHGCPGCPASNPPPASFMLTLGAVTRETFSGTVTGAEGDGSYEVRGDGDQRIFGPVPVGSGSYSVQLPLFCGAQTVAITFCNAAGADTLVYSVATSACTQPDVRATLSWDDIGRDWELHLIKPGGRINDNATDCTWTSCIGRAPDWGVIGDATDDPTKDVDNTGAYGPENIVLPRAEPGVYTVLVEHWGNGSPMSDGRVILNVLGEVVPVEIQDLAPRFVRTAATIEFPSRTVRTSTIVHDCTGNWSGGCRDVIP